MHVQEIWLYSDKQSWRTFFSSNFASFREQKKRPRELLTAGFGLQGQNSSKLSSFSLKVTDLTLNIQTIITNNIDLLLQVTQVSSSRNTNLREGRFSNAVVQGKVLGWALQEGQQSTWWASTRLWLQLTTSAARMAPQYVTTSVCCLNFFALTLSFGLIPLSLNSLDPSKSLLLSARLCVGTVGESLL